MNLNKNSLQLTLEQLQKKYNIIGNIMFFSEFLNKNGEESIFNALNNIRKECFSPDDQIVFVQDCDDEYEYSADESSSGKYISLIQQYLEKIDITNCFVTIVTSNYTIDKEILTVKDAYSHNDKTLINFINIDGNYKKELSKQDTFCVFPWKEIFLKSDSAILPCCIYERPYDLGNLKNESLSEILHGEKIKALRKNMLDDIKSPGCQACYYKENHGLESRRQYYNKISDFSKTDAAKITSPDGDVDDKDLFFDFIELSLDSTCNLKCRCCSGDSSTLIAIEEEKIFGSSYNKNKILNSQEKEIVLNNLGKWLINRTNVIKFAGGEPTLQKQHYQILDSLIENNKEKTTAIHYHINGSNLHYKNISILDYWKVFKNVNVTISIDGYKKTFEYLRHGANWENTKKNIQLIKQTCPHVNLTVISVISSLSIESTMLLQKNFHEEGILLGNSFFTETIQGHNGSYDVQTLPLHHKKRIAAMIDDHCSWLNSKNQTILSEQWRQIKNYMLSSDKTHKLSQARRDIMLIDSFRKENFFKVFPTLSDIFDNIQDTAN